MKLRSALAVFWVFLCLRNIGSRWDEIWWFLFSVSKEDFRHLPEFDPQKVWHASDAMGWFICLIFWSFFLGHYIFKLFKEKAKNDTKNATHIQNV